MKFASEDLIKFVTESNAIENICRDPTDEELTEAVKFLACPSISISDLSLFVRVYEPGAYLRTKKGDDVRVGNHHPPSGGQRIVTSLEELLDSHNMKTMHPFYTHQAYESLHPFLDCNGRSGRILWAHGMLHQGLWPGIRLGFLHAWYYQSLQFYRQSYGE